MEYEPESFNPSAVTRAIIIVHGKGRDAWKYYRAMQKAITESAVNAESIFILAPEFLTRQDLDLAQAGSLIWNGNGWMDGDDSYFGGNVSSLTVLDTIINNFANKDWFPSLQSVVLAGHSGGGQLVQRYSLVGNDPPNGLSLRYVIANPSSYAYLDGDRPRAFNPITCPGWNTWKYGIINPPPYAINSLRVRGFADLNSVKEDFASRDIRYLYGQYDNFTSGPIDVSCEAMAQGVSHLDRGLSWWSFMTAILPMQNFRQDIEVVPGVGHNASGMFLSKAGLTALFD
ncbi:hypothetical protein INT43_002973 [Umbelopsis isabellina]|uniref:Alpha/beta hydrolase n=1 Tax=Mortierella isabellina TaxID=91625 RepID=A0A8H7U6M2_MORIS|nr:hypothetical protein INT43_002973 [Umbelopsis isabellina]